MGSVAYVFCLALVLWLLGLPLRPRHWSYRNVLVFVTLTSPPALLYAIPVEQFMAMQDAQRANAWFLAIVATWRVALLVWFLRRVSGLSRWATAVAALLPLSLIVFVLAALNLEHVVFNLMAGIRDESPSGNDAAYSIVFLLAMWSFFAGPVLAVIYVVMVIDAWHQRR